jgi:hypothetical protein
LGDVQITLADDEAVIRVYEMKARRISQGDIDRALQKLTQARRSVQHYVFITTEPIEEQAMEYARTMYEVSGIEFVILDCIGFLRHFLHLFHRHRMRFLDSYQALLLAEPESAVGQALKEAFLALRRAAQSEG